MLCSGSASGGESIRSASADHTVARLPGSAARQVDPGLNGASGSLQAKALGWCSPAGVPRPEAVRPAHPTETSAVMARAPREASRVRRPAPPPLPPTDPSLSERRRSGPEFEVSPPNGPDQHQRVEAFPRSSGLSLPAVEATAAFGRAPPGGSTSRQAGSARLLQRAWLSERVEQLSAACGPSTVGPLPGPRAQDPRETTERASNPQPPERPPSPSSSRIL